MKNIVLIGMPGCGKSTIGRIVAKRLKLDFIDMDQCIVVKCNMKIKDIFKEKSEAYFRQIEKDVAKEVSLLNKVVISTGGGVVMNKINMDNLSKNANIIYVDRSIEDILSDVDTDSRPLLKDNKMKLLDLYNKRKDLYKGYSDFVVKNDRDIEHVVKSIIAIFNSL